MEFAVNRKYRKNEFGFALPIVLVMIALIAVVTVYMISRSTASSKQSIYTNGTFQGSNIITQVTNLIQDSTAWDHTLYANAAMSCLKFSPGVDCYAASTANGSTYVQNVTYPTTMTGSFVLYDRSGKIFYDSTAATNGFDYTGQPCPYTTSNSYSNSSNTKTYGDSSGQCPFRLVLWWQPHCTPASSPCNLNNAHLDYYTIYGYLLFSPVGNNTYKVPFRPENYKISIKKSTTAANANYCCAIECKRTTADAGTAYVTKTIVQSANCYPGSSEVPSSICGDVFAADPDEWAYDGNVVTNSGTCAGG